MVVHELRRALWVPRGINEVFAFFADAGNLEAITPEWLNFEILTDRPIRMRAGTRIDYRIRLHGIAMGWRTLISEWDPPHRFVDEQIRGPYRRWHHTHTFEALNGGTVCSDRVEYAMHGGELVHRHFVLPRLTRIFDYRTERLEQLLGAEVSSKRGVARA